MARPVPIAPCRSPFAASRPAPSCAPAPEQRHGGHISPTPPLPCRRGWGCCVWGDKTARLLRKSTQLLRETCRLFAPPPSSSSTLHTLPIGLVALACTPPGTIRTENLRKIPSSPLFPSPPPAALAKSAPFANPLQKRRFRPRFRGQKRAKKQPNGAFSPAFLAQNG